MPELVPQQLVFAAMGLNTTGWNLARIVGPALAGLLIALIAGGDKQSTFGVGVVYHGDCGTLFHLRHYHAVD